MIDKPDMDWSDLLLMPEPMSTMVTMDVDEAVDRLVEIYERNSGFIQTHFRQLLDNGVPQGRVRACYPFARLTTTRYTRPDSRSSYGFVAGPGTYQTTLSRPDLFRGYLIEQFGKLIDSHGVGIEIGESDSPIPLHFAFPEGMHVEGGLSQRLDVQLREVFDVPDLAVTDDAIANGEHETLPGEPMPLAAFPAQRVDYSLHRLAHYTATSPTHFQNFVLFTNYQFYIDEFCALAHEIMRSGEGEYDCFVEPGNVITQMGDDGPREGIAPARLPQMPAYHLCRKGHSGITMVNIGVGPSNAKTITDHIAVLRPAAWLMLGHCAGLRNSQRLGDYVLAHGYVREDHVLDADLPTWVPIPPLAEVQVALEQAVAEVTGLTGYELKSVMRTGTVATIDNRNWELRDHREPVQRFSQSRAIALDMESATIAANGFRFRVPYGTLLCVSDKPLHGELKLPGMASDFYKRQVAQHLKIGIRAVEKMREMPAERLHSRKLRSFAETAFQ